MGSPDIHVALIKGTPSEGITTVRVHGFNPVRDLLHVKAPNQNSWHLDSVLKTLAASERGVLVWIGQPALNDLGSALSEICGQQQPNAKALSQQYRTIGVGAQILRDLGVQKMRLLSSPLRFNALSGFDLEVVEYLSPERTTEN
jgi:3,4-dihydroxy 2-butanone 4-phosphate synthase/GTP cyclohydrolase II